MPAVSMNGIARDVSELVTNHTYQTAFIVPWLKLLPVRDWERGEGSTSHELECAEEDARAPCRLKTYALQ